MKNVRDTLLSLTLADCRRSVRADTMRKRFISLMLALLYFSVSLAFSSHVHDDSKGLSHQCLACAWHFESTTDTPAGPVLVCPPRIVLERAPDSEARAAAGFFLVRSDRGPPLLS